jgi:hypothetical protein
MGGFYGRVPPGRHIGFADRITSSHSRGEVLVSILAAAVFNLNHPAHTVDWEFIHLSVANVVVIGLMFLVFFLAILLPFPGAAARRRGGASS